MKPKKRKKLGLPPGTVVFTGNQKIDQVQVHYLKYNNSDFEALDLSNHDEIIFNQSSKEFVDWYDIRGLHDTSLIELIGKNFSVHPLVLEDIADINQRPKFDEYETGNFIVIKALHYNKEKKEITTEQVALYFMDGFLATFQETESDLFLFARKRILGNKGRVRTKGADYLAYVLMDTIIDHYYIIFDEIEAEIEDIEYRMIENPTINSKSEIHQLRRELLTIRKSIAPLRDAISKFSKAEAFVEEGNTIYIRDLHDHVIQILEMLDSQREILGGLQDLFLTEVSFKMNQIMQTLTIISVIFIPLSFFAGVYGMNFDHIPELHHKYGYFIFWGFLILVVSIQFFFFRKKKWL